MLGVTETAGIVANIMSNVAFVPQIIKSFRRKCVKDVSLLMFVMLFTTQICWIVYAIPIGAHELTISCTIEIFLLLPIFAMWVAYRNNERPR